ASAQQRLNAVWTLTRIDGSDARAAVRAALHSEDENVIRAAIHSTGLHRDAAATEALARLLGSSRLHVQRSAATALGQIGSKQLAAAMISTVHHKPDRILEHALIYALIDVGDREAATRVFAEGDAELKRIGLIALDQMDEGNLQVGQVAPFLTSK